MKKEEIPFDESKEAVLSFLNSVNAEPEIVYAFEKTGIVVTKTNKDILSEQELQDWNNAIAEFYNPQ